MRRSLCRLQFAGFLFTVTAGALLHFAYAACGGSPILAAVAAVNESTWEHMKLLFFPSFLYALFESVPLRRRYPCFWCAKLAGISTGVALIPGLFYTLTGAFGRTPDIVNIAVFFVAAAAEYLLETHILTATRSGEGGDCASPGGKGKRPPCRTPSPRAALAILWLLSLAFALFTFFPPDIPLFRDPVTGGSGIR